MPVDTAALPRVSALSGPPVPDSATLAAAAAGRRSALAEVLAYAHHFATAYCRAELGADIVSDRLAAEVATAIATGWPPARVARRDFLEFAHATTHRAVRICRYETPGPHPFTSLTAPQRELLTLRVIVGLTPTETAVALGIPVLTVHRRTARALALLKRRAHHPSRPTAA